jgi:hypothetical protein
MLPGKIGEYRYIDYIIEHIPPQLRIVLATRSDPPLPLPLLRVEVGPILGEEKRNMLELKYLLTHYAVLGLELSYLAITSFCAWQIGFDHPASIHSDQRHGGVKLRSPD